MVGPSGYDRATVKKLGRLRWRQRSQQQLKDRRLQWISSFFSP